MRFAQYAVPMVMLALAQAGCSTPPLELGPGNSLQADGLIVHMSLPRRDFILGQHVEVTITAANTTKQPIRFNANSSALVIVRLFRHAGTHWEFVRQYPESAAMLMSPWQLEGGAQRVFRLKLPVEPDWPSNERLRLTGELNGRDDLAPDMLIRIHAADKGSQ